MGQQIVRLFLFVTMIALSACSLPRGAPIKSEIVGSDEDAAAELDIAIEPVTRAQVNTLNSWPSVGWHGHYHWFAAQRGPSATLIQPGDTLNLTVWDNSDNSLLTGAEERSVAVSALEVSPSGTVFVPYAEAVKVTGMSSSQARDLIQERIASVAPDVQVQLELVPGVNNSVFLVSGVLNAGQYPLPNRNFSILSMLSIGGGISPSIENPLVRVVRSGSNYEIPAKVLFSDASKNVFLRGGDQIIVEEDQRYFTAFGTTQKEELIYFDREKINAIDALSMMGGLIDNRANPQGVLVLREFPTSSVKDDRSGPDNEYVVFTIDLTNPDGLFAARKFLIQPGDTVLATESSVRAAQAVIALIGSLFAITNVFD